MTYPGDTDTSPEKKRTIHSVRTKAKSGSQNGPQKENNQDIRTGVRILQMQGRDAAATYLWGKLNNVLRRSRDHSLTSYKVGAGGVVEKTNTLLYFLLAEASSERVGLVRNQNFDLHDAH